MKQYYSLVRTLHLHFGLMISPFILIFSFSVFWFNHPSIFNSYEIQESDVTTKRVGALQSLETDLLTAKEIIRQLDVTGEIDWISKTDTTISFPVHKPGLSMNIFLNTKTGEVRVQNQVKGIGNGMVYLHTMPGPHNAMLRGNSFFMKVWRVVTDTLVYIVLFVTASGIFLWYFLKPERALGLYSLGAGIMLFIVLMFLLL